MKKQILVICALVMAVALAACGGDDSTSSGSGGNGSAYDAKSGGPAFSGETLKFFGMEGEEAFELLGDGGVTSDMKYMSNDKNGMEVILGNSAEALDTYMVNEVRLQGNSDVTFNGIKVGDSLKDTDKKLMSGGAEYQTGLLWKTTIDGELYRIQLSTTDDKTISAIDATWIQDLGNGEGETPDLSNSFSYQEDPHDFEPNYWE